MRKISAKKSLSIPLPLTPAQPGFDEGNVARLGLISVQERIPDDFTSWENQFVLSGRTVKLTCAAPSLYGGVPHGLDNDVATALLELYLEEGSPEDGVIEVSAYALMGRAGWDRKGHYYSALERSLYRLRSATYTAQDAWYDKGLKHLSTATFNYLEDLNYFTVEHKASSTGPFSHKTVIRLRLAAPIVRSVRARYLKPLDMAFLHSLERPLTRAVYRLLDAQRYTLSLEAQADVFEVGLQAWAQACKLFDLRPEKIRRTLEGAHVELITRGYLREVVYLGRGSKQSIRYCFGEVQNLVETRVVNGGDDLLLQSFRAEGVSRAVGVALVAEFGESRAAERLKKACLLMTGGYKPRNKAGFVVDVVRDEVGKYADPEGFVSDERRQVQEGVQRGVKVRQARLDRQVLLQEAERPLEERVDDVLKTVKFLCGDRMGGLQQALLRTLLLGGGAPERVSTQLSRAKLSGTLDVAVTALISQLQEGSLQ